jgi:hypothetical protein
LQTAGTARIPAVRGKSQTRIGGSKKLARTREVPEMMLDVEEILKRQSRVGPDAKEEEEPNGIQLWEIKALGMRSQTSRGRRDYG